VLVANENSQKFSGPSDTTLDVGSNSMGLKGKISFLISTDFISKPSVLKLATLMFGWHKALEMQEIKSQLSATNETAKSGL